MSENFEEPLLNTSEEDSTTGIEYRLRLALFRFLGTFMGVLVVGLLFWGLNSAKIYFLPFVFFAWIQSFQEVLYLTLDFAVIAFISGVCNKQWLTMVVTFILTPLYIYGLNAPVAPKDQVAFFVTLCFITLFNVGFAFWISSEDF